jgi:hypothetical protein
MAMVQGVRNSLKISKGIPGRRSNFLKHGADEVTTAMKDTINSKYASTCENKH